TAVFLFPVLALGHYGSFWSIVFDDWRHKGKSVRRSGLIETLVPAEFGIGIEVAAFGNIHGIAIQAHGFVLAALVMHGHVAAHAAQLFRLPAAFGALAHEVAGGDRGQRFVMPLLAFRADLDAAGHGDDIARTAIFPTVVAARTDDDYGA